MSDVLDELQSRIGYRFRDRTHLEVAFTHTSYIPENPKLQSNQRLEFLGDAVLQLILTQALFELYPNEREGVLSKRRAALTKGSFLVELARDLKLDVCLRVGTSEEAMGGRQRASALEDAFEALVGALYLDSDFLQTSAVVLKLYGNVPERLAATESEENPKGRLQEIVQPQHGNHALRYEVAGIEGEDHARAYEVQVFLLDRPLGRGRGPPKKIAEEAAARTALETLKAGMAR